MERRERIWFRDAEAAEAIDAILFIGLLPGWYPPNYDCGACGYATCAEFLHHTKTLRGHKATGFDRTMPEADFDNLDLPATGTQPVGVPGATQHDGAGNRQAPRHPPFAGRAIRDAPFSWRRSRDPVGDPTGCNSGFIR